jgi:hypothetical protein
MELVLAGVAATLAAGVVAAAAAPPAGTPDITQMALRAADVPTAKVSAQRTAAGSSGYQSGFERRLELKKPFGRSLIVFLDSEIALAETAATPTKDFAGIQRTLRTPKGREALAAVVVRSAGRSVRRKDLTLGKIRAPRVGDAALELPVSVRFKSLQIYETILVFRLDRVLSTLISAAARPVVAAETAKLAALVVSHVGEQLVPLPVGPPTITGTAQQGQMLTATAGSWGNKPQLGYQWQRCDAAGAGCTDIAGAAASTYAVTPAEVGATLRVVEKATNRFGTATAQSAQTAVVT